MKTLLIGIAAAVGLGVLLVSSSSRAQGKGAKKVLAVGDSFTAGPYPKLLEAILPEGSSVTALGYSKKGAAFIHENASNALNSGDYDVVVILAGVNDLSSNRGATVAYINLAKMYAEAMAAGAVVVAVEVLPWGGTEYGAKRLTETAELNRLIQQSDNVDFVVDTQSMGDGTGRLLKKYDNGSGLHLNRAGNEKLAELVAAAVGQEI
jgi:lysophospholipase L1-like esterase